MRSLNKFAFVAALALASTPAAAELGRGYVFPSSANVVGNFQAHFKTKLVLYNPNSVSITIVAQLLTPTGGSAIKNITLEPYRIETWNNFLDEEFNYYGGAGIGLIESTMSRFFYAVGEVYVEGPNGRYITPLQPLFTRDRIPDPSSSASAGSYGLRIDGSNRGNMGCANADGIATTVVGRAHGWNGSSWTSQDVRFDLPPSGWQQLPVPVQGDFVYVDFHLTSGGGGMMGTYCYAVNVNNASNDGTVIPAQRFPPAN